MTERPGDDDGTEGRPRRDVLRSTLAAGLLGGMASAGGGFGATGAAAANDRPAYADGRLDRVQALRNHLASENLDDAPAPAPGEHPTNGDEERYDRYVASFTKGLPHDEHGRVASTDDYERLVAALESVAGSGDFEAVELGGERGLATPGAAGTVPLTGRDSNEVELAPPPAFDGDAMLAETVELYWRALLRDVPFHEYGASMRARRAARELDGLDGYFGPTNDRGTVDAGVLFRGRAAGATDGPLVSQFLYKPVPRGNVRHDQTFDPYEPGVDYATDYDDWLALRNGDVPGYGEGDGSASGARRRGTERYPITGRDLATYVHGNVPAQSFRKAALILLDAGVPLDPDAPTAASDVQSPFVDYGPGGVLSAIGAVVQPALFAAWYHKWRVHRRLRPETVGGRIHDHLTGGPNYEALPADLLDHRALAETVYEHDSFLLPQAYPEGSPTHPSYPSGHAVIAGACATVVKTYFDDEATVPDPVAPDPASDGRELRSIDADLTVAGEVNKLATNDSLGRDFAGIHYRSDAAFPTDDGLDGGLVLGERVAHAWLRDRLTACARSAPLEYASIEGERRTASPH